VAPARLFYPLCRWASPPFDEAHSQLENVANTNTLQLEAALATQPFPALITTPAPRQVEVVEVH